MSGSELVRSGKACWWCGRMLKPSGVGSPRSRTREHIIPRAHGGSNHEGNIKAACQQCNHARGMDTEWVGWIDHGGVFIEAMPESQRRVLASIKDRRTPNRGKKRASA